MAKIYAALIRKDIKTLDEVPARKGIFKDIPDSGCRSQDGCPCRLAGADCLPR